MDIWPTRQSTTPHPRIGTTIFESMGEFHIGPLATTQSQRKLRPSNFKKLVENFDGMKDPHNHMANIQQVTRAE